MRLLLAILVAWSASCAAPGGPPLYAIATEVNATLDTGAYVVGPGDVLQVTLPERPELSHTAIVQPDGLASFVDIGPLATAGLKPGQIEQELQRRYVDVAGARKVTVQISQLAPRHVTVLGEVKAPGEVLVELGQRMTLMDALAGAKGYIKDTARLGSVVLVRWDAEQRRQLSWTVDARPRTWTGESSILLQPFDLVYVPNTPVDNVNIFVDKYIRQNIPFPRLVAVQ